MSEPKSMPTSPHLSVILAVYDRVDCLRVCLECLKAQTLERSEWELVLVSDGGPKEIEELTKSFSDDFAIQFFDQENAGPARARNLAMSKAKGSQFVFLNDDVRFDENFLAVYHAYLKEHPDVAVAGNTRWAQETITEDFTHWNAHQDHVFYLIHDPENMSWEFWHTLNASLPRRWFDEGHLFDETFPDPAFEDTEYIYRLTKKHGLRITFLAEAILEHAHPFTFEEYCRKSFTRGKSAARFLAYYPDLTERILFMPESEVSKKIRDGEAISVPDTLEKKGIKSHAAFLAGYLEGKKLLN